MSLRFQSIGPIPPNTSAVVKAAFRRKGHPYIAFADEFRSEFDCDDFTEFYSRMGQSAIHPGILSLAIILQAAEGLSDRQAADAVRDKLTWKYVLGLELDDDGWDHSVFSAFRERLIKNGAERLVFDKMVHLAQERGLLDTSKQRTDSTHILSCAKALNRLELLHEVVRLAIEALTEVSPRWILSIARPHWRTRYFEDRPFNYKLSNKEKARTELTVSVGEDGYCILQAIDESNESVKLNKLSEIQMLKRVWEEQFTRDDSGKPKPKEKSERAPSADRIASPHDSDARWATKGKHSWIGYKAHITETYSEGSPHLITDIQTTIAPLNDSLALPLIHRSLRSRGLSPREHLVDSGYVNVSHIAACSSQFDTDVVTRLANGHTWQSKENKGFDILHFVIDHKSKTAICPEGFKSKTWKNRGGAEPGFNVVFDSKICNACPKRQECTKSDNGRVLHVKEQLDHEFMVSQRHREKTLQWKMQYARRSGIESAISYLIRQTGTRRSTTPGFRATELKNSLAAAGLNLKKLGNWLMNPTIAGTRMSNYQLLTVAS